MEKKFSLDELSDEVEVFAIVVLNAVKELFGEYGLRVFSEKITADYEAVMKKSKCDCEKCDCEKGENE